MEIDLTQLIHKEDVVINLKGKNKKAVISSLLDHLISAQHIDKSRKKDLVRVIVQREEIGSTAIGGHIALPHARLDGIKGVEMIIGISKEGVDFESLDEEPVYVIVLLLSDQKEAGLHLKTLAFLAKLLRDKMFVQQLRGAVTGIEVIDLFARQQSAAR